MWSAKSGFGDLYLPSPDHHYQAAGLLQTSIMYLLCIHFETFSRPTKHKRWWPANP